MNRENPEVAPASFRSGCMAWANPTWGSLVRDTYALRRFKNWARWHQDALDAAMLGLPEDASNDVAKNFTMTVARFQAFWVPSADWIPDMDNGGVGMAALQRMVLQCEGRQVLMLPAWPKDWDLDFKLRGAVGYDGRRRRQGWAIDQDDRDPRELRLRMLLWPRGGILASESLASFERMTSAAVVGGEAVFGGRGHVREGGGIGGRGGRGSGRAAMGFHRKPGSSAGSQQDVAQ